MLNNEEIELVSRPITKNTDISKLKEALLIQYEKKITKLYSKSLGKLKEYILGDPVKTSMESAFFIATKDRLFVCGFYHVSIAERAERSFSALRTKGVLYIYFHGKVLALPADGLSSSSFFRPNSWSSSRAVIFDTVKGMTYAKYREIYYDSDIRSVYYIDSVVDPKTNKGFNNLFKDGNYVRKFDGLGFSDFGRPGVIQIDKSKIGLTENYLYDLNDESIHKILWPMNRYVEYAPIGWYRAYDVSRGTRYPLEDEIYDYYYFSKSSMQAFYSIMELIPEEAELIFIENLLPYDTSINYCLKISKEINQTALCKKFFSTEHVGPKIFDVLISAVVEYLETESENTPIKYEKIWPRNTREAVVQEIEAYYHIKREAVLDLLYTHYGAIISHYDKNWFLVEGPAGEVDYPRKIKIINRLNIRWKHEVRLYNMVFSYFPDALYQYRADWLEGLILDIYIPSIKVAIEYQGEQHYLPLDHLGGVEGLKERQKRDAIKRDACKNQGIKLIEWKYTIPVVSVHLVQLMREIGVDLTSINLDLSRKEAYEIGINNYSKENKNSRSSKRKI